MRFKRVYGNGRYSIGPFYMSDIKKVAGIVREAPYGIEDDLGDPEDYFKFLAKYESSMLFTGRDNKKVVVFGSLNYIVEGKDAFFGGYAYRKAYHATVECGRLMAYYGFQRWNLRRMTAMHSIKNRAATLVDLKIGFKKEGILRSAMVFNGELHDAQIMGLTREEVEKWPLVQQ